MPYTFTTVADSELDPESPLNTNLANAFYKNPLAIVEGDATASSYRVQTAALEQASGSEAVTQACMRASSVGQAEIKTATASSSVNIVNGSTGSLTLTGGTYSMYTCSSTSSSARDGIQFGAGNTAAGVLGLGNDSGSNETFYVDERYIQSSPPYGDPETNDHWHLFVYLKIKDKKIIAACVAPDATWHNNGPTCIHGKLEVSEIEAELGVKEVREYYLHLVRSGDVKKAQDILDQVRNGPRTHIEPDFKLKHADCELEPHPWHHSPLQKGEKVVMLDPRETHRLLFLYEGLGSKDIFNMVLDGKIKVTNTYSYKQLPSGILCAGFKL